MSDDANPAQDALDVRHHAELTEQAQVGRDLTHGGLRNARMLGVSARLEVEDVDLEAGIGEDMADAAPHATRTQCGDPQERGSFTCAGGSDARPSFSSVRPSARRSRPSTAEPSASRPRATGQATPAHSHTETRKARPSSTSSRM